jgi:hypothetical protein
MDIAQIAILVTGIGYIIAGIYVLTCLDNAYASERSSEPWAQAEMVDLGQLGTIWMGAIFWPVPVTYWFVKWIRSTTKPILANMRRRYVKRGFVLGF